MALITAEEARSKVTTYKTNQKNTCKTINSLLINAIGVDIDEAASGGNYSCNYVSSNNIEYELLKEILENAGYEVTVKKYGYGISTISISWSK